MPGPLQSRRLLPSLLRCHRRRLYFGQVPPHGCQLRFCNLLGPPLICRGLTLRDQPCLCRRHLHPLLVLCAQLLNLVLQPRGWRQCPAKCKAGRQVRGSESGPVQD